ncbi:uncharacterized protein PHALS_01748 [Plasmopara halstedii]|uniref:Uncharacterized protein n=1 Tax=Plasmopara halstedii TaxID=4781 RepID=A0A0P1AUX1_PLAHL|nr:uncharacterized protein PHALS_01748 [Plasmopara halstedii]CEG45454.1 hypothetical protein PHALS_01748 [Plasmopara halstedii]|eukprot:XP_024581823.1 hypothetical protein PHALS_01748 [Plasmopara halstedii]
MAKRIRFDTCEQHEQCQRVQQSAETRSQIHEKFTTIPVCDQEVLLSRSVPSPVRQPLGAKQLHMKVCETNLVEVTTISTIEIDNSTKKAFGQAYEKDPLYAEMWSGANQLWFDVKK